MLSDKIKSCFTLSQLDLLRVEILQDRDNFKENQALFVSQQGKIKRGVVKSSLVVTDFLYTTYDRQITRRNGGTGKRMNLGSETVRCCEINFLGEYWTVENVGKGLDDTTVFEKKSWSINNGRKYFTRYTLLTPSGQCLDKDWVDYFIEKFKKEYYLFEGDKKCYLFRKDIDVRKVAIKGTRIKWNKDFNYVVSISKADCIYLKTNGVVVKDILNNEVNPF